MVRRLLILDACPVGNRIVAVADHGYIVLSDDGGKSWRRAKAPSAPLLTAVDFRDEKVGLAVGHDTTILGTDDGGETWTQRFSDPKAQGPLLDVTFLPPGSPPAGAGPNGLGGRGRLLRRVLREHRRQEDLGVTARSPSRRQAFQLDRAPGRGPAHDLRPKAGTILASADSGKTWIPVALSLPGLLLPAPRSLPTARRSMSPTACAAISSARSTGTQELAWQIETTSNASLLGSERLPDGSLVLAGAAGTALVSRDNGATFQPIETHTTRMLVKPLPGPDSTILLLGEGGPREAALAPRR